MLGIQAIRSASSLLMSASEEVELEATEREGGGGRERGGLEESWCRVTCVRVVTGRVDSVEKSYLDMICR